MLVLFEEAEKENKRINRSAIGRRYDLHPQQVQRILDGTAKLDGFGGGGRTLLTPPEEYTVVTIAKQLVKAGRTLHYSHFRDIARAVFVHCHPGTPVPLFSREWFEAFSHRWPEAPIKAGNVQPVEQRRFNASKRSTINSALQHIKSQLEKLGSDVECDRVYFADETDVTLNFESAGKRAYSVGNAHPKSIRGPDRPHISALAFCNFDGEIANISFFLGLPPSLRASLKPPRFLLPGTKLVCNANGSSECDDSDGHIGSYHTAIEAFVDYVEERHEGKRVALIVDSLFAHCQESVKKTLETKNVLLVTLSPNLTHLIQMQDRPSLFGFLKGKLRNFTHDLGSSSRRLDLEDYCREIERHIIACHGILHIDQAAEECGFEIFPDKLKVHHLRITDESISRRLNQMILAGLIEDDVAPANNYRDQQRHDYLKLRELYECGETKKLSQACPESKHFVQFPMTEDLFKFYLDYVKSQLHQKQAVLPGRFAPRKHITNSTIENHGNPKLKKNTVEITKEIFAAEATKRRKTEQKRGPKRCRTKTQNQEDTPAATAAASSCAVAEETPLFPHLWDGLFVHYPKNS